MKLKRLLKGLDGKTSLLGGDAEITSIAIDSRHVRKGALFVAIKGFKTDGSRFIKEAIEKGARAIVTEEKICDLSRDVSNILVSNSKKALSIVTKNFYNSPSERLKVVGITGTNGKTTVAFLTQSIFNASGVPCGLIGTVECRSGKGVTASTMTTPDALSVNFLLDRMIENGLKAVSMEVSSHALDQLRVDDLLFDVAIFTNLTHEHLDYHGSLKNYMAAKMRIFKNLKRGGSAIINTDDISGRKALRRIEGRKIVTYGLRGKPHISADIKEANIYGSKLIIKVHKTDEIPVNTRLIGMHNISNILAATAAGIAQGFSGKDIKRGIEKVNAVTGRLEPVEMGQQFKIFIDYAHTHRALENVLTFLKKLRSEGRIITVFGCGGERDKKKRPLMGAIAQKYSDIAIITNDNPRNEDPEMIIRDIISGIDERKAGFFVMKNRKKAIEKALKEARTGDIVLIAGKGHENTQVVGSKAFPFNDKEITESLLRKSSRAMVTSSLRGAVKS
ncbi:MAG: UDP-N-acetylmuramoyl-L-alanyl-D-glutamate--2,6-diaminopimelate ligase [Candidatus Omnitrophota bacterium]